MEAFARNLAGLLRTSTRIQGSNVRRQAAPFIYNSASPTSIRSISQAGKSARNRIGLPKAKHSVIAGAALLISASLLWPSNAQAETPPEAPPKESGLTSNGKKLRLDDVRKHGTVETGYWITKGTRVYDVTDWVPNHPGGDVILRGVGGAVDPYWKIFSIHNKQEVYDILEQYYIGDIDPRDLVDGAIPQHSIEDPFATDPKRDARLKQHTDRPCNAETPETELSTYHTPNEVFYVRNHLWVPETSAEDHKLTIELYDGEEKVYTIEDLRTRFKQHTVDAVLQCSGNRRLHMSKGSRKTNGLQWNVGAIGNAQWTGVRLRDVLKDAGMDIDNPDEEIKHAQFTGSEAYGASIPIDKALDRHGDVLLAFEMNGETLPRDHGYPLRVIVPGNVAARSVKWVNKITMSDEESWSQWQRRDYKCFGPNEGSKPDWASAVAIQELPVQSAITSLKTVSCIGPMSSEDHKLLEVFGLEEDCVKLEGYAYSGGGHKIVRVDVSADNGHTWSQAELLDDVPRGSKDWGWRQWRFGISQQNCGRWFLVKAIDDAYNSQSPDFDSQYNFRGNLANAWHRVEYNQAD